MAPTALSGSAQLVSLQIFGSAISTNTVITLPQGTQNGAGGYNNRANINLPQVNASSIPVNGNMANYSVVPVIYTTTGQANVLTLSGFGDIFGSPAVAKVSFV